MKDRAHSGFVPFEDTLREYMRWGIILVNLELIVMEILQNLKWSPLSVNPRASMRIVFFTSTQCSRKSYTEAVKASQG